jgi:polyhydroxybutyrate depolymerase
MTHRGLRAVLPLLLLIPLASACGDGGAAPSASATPSRSDAASTVTIPLGDRSFRLLVPDSYTGDEPAPLLIGLHGYTSNSGQLSSYFNLARHVEERGYLLALPEGSTDRVGDQFWNATDACCDTYGSGKDDSTYLSQLIDLVTQEYEVGAVFLIGHSNGGYMSHRMACEHADQITAIAALAGVLWSDPTRCEPSRPVSVLQIHGTADNLVRYDGGEMFSTGASYPGAEETAARWRAMNGCTDSGTAGPPADLDLGVAGAETAVTTWTEGCDGGSVVALWRMEGSGHSPALNDDFTVAVFVFFDSTL